MAKRVLRKDPKERFASDGEAARALDPLAAPRPAYAPQGPGAARVGDLSVGLPVGDLAELRADVLWRRVGRFVRARRTDLGL